MRATTVSTTVGGQELTIETGRLAKQAGGSVYVRYGDTTVLACATMGPGREGIDFFPLTVDFEAKYYAAGKIPVTFFRREGRPGQKSILTSRMTDRPLRPLFPSGMRNEVQIIVNSLSADPEICPDVLCGLAASAALHLSNIPFHGPIGSVRVGWLDGQPVINPTYTQLAESQLDLMVAGTADAIMMVEAGAKELPSGDLLTALEAGHDAIREICRMQEELRQLAGKEKTDVGLAVTDEDLKDRVRKLMAEPWRAALGQPGKAEHYAALERISEETLTALVADEALEGRDREIKGYIHDIEAEVIRRMILDEGVRADGRDTRTVRPIECEVGCIPRVHGSGLFTRGETQALTIATLGTVGDRKTVDWLYEQYTQRYFHDYNFPPYSVGETKRLGSPGRREIGHGALAERALLAVLPNEDDFPYTMRMVSEILESNGSSSMASVCGSTLALMDAGVPIKAPVAGVAMGLLQEGDRNIVLTDILGLEDHCGDMDFKVCGTENGITALQMDIKCSGLTRDILEQALQQADEALHHIRGQLLACIPAPREELNPSAPRIEIVVIDPEKIAMVIGPGGKVVKKIQEETGAKIDIEQDGRVFVAGPDQASAKAAADIIRNMTREVKIGEEYEGPVTRIFGFGAMVELLPGKEGLVHISKLAAERVGRVEDVVSIGDRLPVRVTEIDDQGRVNLERTDIPIIVNLAEGEGGSRNPRPRDDRGGDRGGRGGDRGGRGGDRGGRGGDRGGRGGYGGDRGGRGGGGGGYGGDRGPRHDDRGPRQDDRGGRGEGDRGPRPSQGGNDYGYGDPERPGPRGRRDDGGDAGGESGGQPNNEPQGEPGGEE